MDKEYAGGVEAVPRTLQTAARYLGLRGDAAAEPAMNAMLHEAYAQMRDAAKPRHRLVHTALRVSPQDGTVCIGNIPPTKSQSLSRLLHTCTDGYALLCTLGMDLDLSIRRLMVTDAALGAAVGACGSAYIDVYIDGILQNEAAALHAQGKGLTRRFSPGYGDAPLAMQPALLALCGAKHLGVRLTQGYLMLPEKSVSAVMGIVDMAQADTCSDGCGVCSQADCQFREEKA